MQEKSQSAVATTALPPKRQFLANFERGALAPAGRTEGEKKLMAKVAVCIASEYEDAELDVPRGRLREAGHEVTIVGSQVGKRLKGRRGRSSISVQKGAREVSAADFDAILIPGGHSPDHLRLDTGMVELVKDAVKQHKLVAAVSHGPQLLIEADVLCNRSITSSASIKRDLVNAGARWKDQDVVEDGIFITSRKPEDLEAFATAILRWLDVGTRASLAS